MAKFAKEQAKNVKNNDIFALNGTLGSGKTFFAKYFISSLVNLDVSQITSPTFNIYSHYQINDLNIYHFDLYRLKHEEELENIGFYDLLKDGVCLIEWPEIAQKYLTNNVIKINFNILGANKREVIIN